MDITIKWGSVLLVAVAAMILMTKLNEVQEQVRNIRPGEQGE